MKDIILLIKGFFMFLFFAGIYFYIDLISGADLVTSLFISSFFGMFMLLGVSGTMTIFREWRDFPLINAAKHGRMPKNNRRCAILGRIEPVLDLLSVPFSLKPCVAYEYYIYHISKTDGASKIYDFEGWALTPSLIKAPFGNVKLLGMLDIKDFSRQEILNYGNANKFIQSTSFKRSTLKNLKSIGTHLKNISTISTEKLGEDIRHSDAPEASGLVLQERCVSSGTYVCAIGKYSSKQKGLLPDSKRGIRLLPSNKHTISKDVKRGMTSHFIIALLFMSFAFMMLFLSPPHQKLLVALFHNIRFSLQGIF